MKSTIFIILLCIAGTFCDFSLDCYFKERNRCDENLIPEKFPGTVDGLKTACKNVVTYGTCMDDIYEICGEDTDTLTEYRNFVSFLNSTCREGNRIYKVVTNNLDCIASTMEKLEGICPLREMSEKSHDVIFKKIEEATNGFENIKMLSCLNEFLRATCGPTVLGDICGEDTKNAAEEFIANTNTILQRCVKEFPEEWNAMYPLFESIILEELRMVYFLEEHR